MTYLEVWAHNDGTVEPSQPQPTPVWPATIEAVFAINLNGLVRHGDAVVHYSTGGTALLPIKVSFEYAEAPWWEIGFDRLTFGATEEYLYYRFEY